MSTNDKKKMTTFSICTSAYTEIESNVYYKGFEEVKARLTFHYYDNMIGFWSRRN